MPAKFYDWANIWIPEATGTKLPRVLLIGDSITAGYGGKVNESLKGKASVAQLATSKSVGDPVLLVEVALVLDQCRFDVVHFNNGLHGWDYSEAEYEKHFPELIATIRKHAPRAKLIWATTTPMRKPKDLSVVAENTKRVQARNKIAEGIVSTEGIAVDDLYGLVKDHTDYWSPDGVHFNAKGIAAQAEQVTTRIRKASGSCCNAARIEWGSDMTRAVGFGGDTDTIGAMAGALVGALHGGLWIPARWYDKMENDAHGPDENRCPGPAAGGARHPVAGVASGGCGCPKPGKKRRKSVWLGFWRRTIRRAFNDEARQKGCQGP